MENLVTSYYNVDGRPVTVQYEGALLYCENLYHNMLESGVAPEMARMVLPQSMMTSWYWTGNLLSFAHVYKERIASGAQLEANWFAQDLDKVIRPLYPVSWEALVGTLYGQGEEDE